MFPKYLCVRKYQYLCFLSTYVFASINIYVSYVPMCSQKKQKVSKKIIFTVTNDLNHDQRMIRICTALAANYDVHLIGRVLPHSKPIVNQSFTQHRLNVWFQKGKLFYAEYNIRLFFFLLKKQFDMVCGIDLDTILPCYLVSKILCV
jgi:hypothetical protein